MNTWLRFTLSVLAIGLLVLLAIGSVLASPTASASTSAALRRPLGIYAHVELTDLIHPGKSGSPAQTQAELDAELESLYQNLLANPAISGLAVGVHWDTLNPNPPSSSQPYDWHYVDDLFKQVALWNAKTPAEAPKTIQISVIPGMDSPQWLLDELPSCDALFQEGGQLPPANCGKATFTGYTEAGGGDSTELPMPWNSIYQSAWQTFLKAFAERYESNPLFVSIAIAGPVATSPEWILPYDGNTPNQTQFGGISPDDMWRKLLAFAYPTQPAYQNSDQAFIDAWNAAIDAYGQIFSGITLDANPDTGEFPNVGKLTPPPQSDMLYYNGDCPNPGVDCAVVTTILTHFIDPAVGGNNGKSTQTGGMKGYNPNPNVGVPGVELLSALTAKLAPAAQILGGDQFDYPFSLNPNGEGCTTGSTCSGISPEQAEYNVLRVFFSGTQASDAFGGTPGSAPLDFLQVFHEDVTYATKHVHDQVSVMQANGTAEMTTAQDMLSMASQKLLQIAER